MKKHIPNLFTFGNLFCGCIAIPYAIQGQYQVVFVWLLGGIFCDFFDGFVARRLKVSSALGMQLDSLADMVTSGVVPGIVMCSMLSKTYNLPLVRFIELLGFLITLASGYRLAKFNIDTRQTTNFIGLPTPANAMFVSSLAVISVSYDGIFYSLLNNYWVLVALTFLSCYLLNSEISLFALKFKNFSFKENVQKYIFLIFCVVVLLFFQVFAIPIIILAYILFSILWKEKN